MDRRDLGGQFADRADAGFEIAARMRRLALDLEDREDAALPARDDIAGRPARFAVEDNARLAGGRLDHLPPLRAADLLIAGEQTDQRAGRAAAASADAQGGAESGAMSASTRMQAPWGVWSL